MAETDIEAIKQVINLYGLAVDTQRWQARLSRAASLCHSWS